MWETNKLQEYCRPFSNAPRCGKLPPPPPPASLLWAARAGLNPSRCRSSQTSPPRCAIAGAVPLAQPRRPVRMVAAWRSPLASLLPFPLLFVAKSRGRCGPGLSPVVVVVSLCPLGVVWWWLPSLAVGRRRPLGRSLRRAVGGALPPWL
jgi:hypothetical protein